MTNADKTSKMTDEEVAKSLCLSRPATTVPTENLGAKISWCLDWLKRW